MSFCKANPCCADPFFCEIPLPQYKTGLYHRNDKDWKKKSREAAPKTDQPLWVNNDGDFVNFHTGKKI